MTSIFDKWAHNKGSVDDKAEASAARRAYAARAASNNDKAATSAVEAGAYDEGSNGDEAAASAAGRAYVASIAADNNKAAASTARCACTAIAALSTAEADGIDNGAHNDGSLNDKAEARAKRRAYAARAAANGNKASASAARRVRAAIMAWRTAQGGDIDNRVCKEGSNDSDAVESAARRGHASAASNEAEASAPTARRVRAASAVQGTAEGGYIVIGTSNEGFDDNEAAESAARRADTSAASDEDEALAPAGRRVCVARAAQRTAEGGDINDGTFNKGSEDNEAAESAARRAYASAASNNDEASAPAAKCVRTASAAQGMAEGGYIVNGTSNEGPDNDKAEASATRHADVASAAALPSIAEAATPRATDKADEAPRNGAWHGRAASARKSSGRQAKARAAQHGHDIDNNDYNVDASGGCNSKQPGKYVSSPKTSTPTMAGTTRGGRPKQVRAPPRWCTPRRPVEPPCKHGRATPSPATRPLLRPIKLRSPARGSTPTQTGAGEKPPMVKK